MQIVSINQKTRNLSTPSVLWGFLIILTVLIAACPMPEPEPITEPEPMDMDTSPLIGVWTADGYTIEFTATTYIDKFSGLTCDYTDNGNSITFSNCMGLEGAENLNGATVEYTIDGDTLTFDGTAYTRQNSDVPEPTVPGTMAAPTFEVGNKQLTVNWTPPEETGDSEITAYHVQHKQSNGEWPADDTAAITPPTSRSTIITGLTNGNPYDVRLRAVNAQGSGNWSESSTETPITVSLAPTAFMLTAGNTTITATWAAPTDTGDSAIIRYELQHREVGTSTWEATVSIAVYANHTYTHLIPNLTNGTEYEVRVYAVNTEGNGNPATGTATPEIPATVPSAPNAPTLTAGNTELEVAWTAPDDDGGSAITGYKVQHRVNTASEWLTSDTANIDTITDGTATSSTITGLTNGNSYDVRVRAVNAVGDGGWSVSATLTLSTAPAAPTGLTLVPVHQSITAAWTAPNNNGGSAITGYDLQFRVSAAALVEGDWQTETTTNRNL